MHKTFSVFAFVLILLFLQISFVAQTTDEPSKTTDQNSKKDTLDEEIQRLFEKAIDKDPAIKMESKLELLEMGKVCYNHLKSAIKDKRPEMRYLACELIATFRDERFKDDLIPLLKDQEGEATSIASVAAWALGRINAKESVPELIQALSSKDPELKHNSVRALGFLRAVESKDKLLSLLVDQTVTFFEERVDVAVIIALGQLKQKDTVEKLIPLLSNINKDVARGEEVRYYAAKALERITGEKNGPLSGDKETIEKTYDKWHEWWIKNRQKYESQKPPEDEKDKEKKDEVKKEETKESKEEIKEELKKEETKEENK